MLIGNSSYGWSGTINKRGQLRNRQMVNHNTEGCESEVVITALLDGWISITADDNNYYTEDDYYFFLISITVCCMVIIVLG